MSLNLIDDERYADIGTKGITDDNLLLLYQKTAFHHNRKIILDPSM